MCFSHPSRAEAWGSEPKPLLEITAENTPTNQISLVPIQLSLKGNSKEKRLKRSKWGY